MTAEKPIIVCPRCEGIGRIPMSDSQWLILRQLDLRDGITATQIHRRRAVRAQGRTVTNVNNVLEDLRKLGWAHRVRTGRNYQYFLLHKP